MLIKQNCFILFSTSLIDFLCGYFGWDYAQMLNRKKLCNKDRKMNKRIKKEKYREKGGKE